MRLKFLRFSFIFLAAPFLLGLSTSEVKKHILLEEKIINVEVRNLQGNKTFLLPPELDKPVLLNIWATWCAPCVKELPILDKLAKKNDLHVIALSTDAKLETVQNFLLRNNLKSMKVLWDAFGRKSRTHLHARGLPMTLLIDKQGTIKKVFLGEKDWGNEEMYQNLLESVQ